MSSPTAESLSIESLSHYKVAGAPDSIYYIPIYISEAEEAELLRRVDSAPLPKWTTLSNRRLQNWGGLPHPKGMIAEPLPEWLAPYCNRISEIGVFGGSESGKKRANHVLVNEYMSGQGILPHEDGPLYQPTVTTISLGSHALLDFYNKQSEDGDFGNNESSPQQRYVASVLVQPRSLLVVQDQAYTHCLHGIKEVMQDELTDAVSNLGQMNGQDSSNGNVLRAGDMMERGRRVSLTIRHVPKVIKSKILLRRK